MTDVPETNIQTHTTSFPVPEKCIRDDIPRLKFFGSLIDFKSRASNWRETILIHKRLQWNIRIRSNLNLLNASRECFRGLACFPKKSNRKEHHSIPREIILLLEVIDPIVKQSIEDRRGP
jgi:hypothetical protein